MKLFSIFFLMAMSMGLFPLVAGHSPSSNQVAPEAPKADVVPEKAPEAPSESKESSTEANSEDSTPAQVAEDDSDSTSAPSQDDYVAPEIADCGQCPDDMADQKQDKHDENQPYN